MNSDRNGQWHANQNIWLVGIWFVVLPAKTENGSGERMTWICQYFFSSCLSCMCTICFGVCICPLIPTHNLILQSLTLTAACAAVEAHTEEPTTVVKTLIWTIIAAVIFFIVSPKLTQYQCLWYEDSFRNPRYFGSTGSDASKHKRSSAVIENRAYTQLHLK